MALWWELPFNKVDAGSHFSPSDRTSTLQRLRANHRSPNVETRIPKYLAGYYFFHVDRLRARGVSRGVLLSSSTSQCAQEVVLRHLILRS